MTEDLVFMLHSMGYETGINLPELIEVRKKLAEQISGSSIYGFIADAGLPLGFSQSSHAINGDEAHS